MTPTNSSSNQQPTTTTIIDNHEKNTTRAIMCESWLTSRSHMKKSRVRLISIVWLVRHTLLCDVRHLCGVQIPHIPRSPVTITIMWDEIVCQLFTYTQYFWMSKNNDKYTDNQTYTPPPQTMQNARRRYSHFAISIKPFTVRRTIRTRIVNWSKHSWAEILRLTLDGWNHSLISANPQPASAGRTISSYNWLDYCECFAQCHGHEGVRECDTYWHIKSTP